jgi:hypothetical protein
MSSQSRRIKDIHTPSSLSPNNSKSRKRKLDTSETTSLSPNNSKSRKRKLDTSETTSLSPKKIKILEPYINKSFEFLRDTSIVKTGYVRDKRETELADVIKETNKKLLLDTSETTSLSPKEYKEFLEPYINKSFEFLRDTSIVKTGYVRDKCETELADVIKETNKKLLLKYPHLNNNVKFAAMIKGTDTRTFGGKVKKIYKNNNTKKRRRVNRKTM